MLFSVLARGAYFPTDDVDKAYLREDNWDDWAKYRTMFQLVVFDHERKRHDIGDVKIGQEGLLPGATVAPNTRAPSIPREFDQLPTDYFSLGQSETYYEALNELPLDLKEQVLLGLQDCARDLTKLDSIENEYVLTESLLRDISITNVRNRFHRLSQGNAVLTAYEFSFAIPSTGTIRPTVEVRVVPESVPPTNVHVLIGRNGVGKTRVMQGIASSLLDRELQRDDVGEVTQQGENQGDWAFANLVSVSFSAFDEFDLPESLSPSLRASSIGLRQRTQEGNDKKFIVKNNRGRTTVYQQKSPKHDSGRVLPAYFG